VLVTDFPDYQGLTQTVQLVSLAAQDFCNVWVHNAFLFNPVQELCVNRGGCLISAGCLVSTLQYLWHKLSLQLTGHAETDLLFFCNYLTKIEVHYTVMDQNFKDSKYEVIVTKTKMLEVNPEVSLPDRTLL